MTSGDNSITCESGLDSDVVLSYGTFYNVKSGDTIKLLDRIVVTEEVKEFTVWMWIDSNGTDLSSLSGETIDANLWTEFTMYDESGPKVIVNFDLNGGDMEDISYTAAGEYEFVVPYDGEYQLEVWGAQGGSVASTYAGGNGGYSVGSIQLNKNEKIYINVGGHGTNSSGKGSAGVGGYNGGGDGGSNATCQGGGGGGGATHIATVSGELSTLESYKGKLYADELVYNSRNILIVAGGGGGGRYHCGGYNYAGGSGGGFKGTTLGQTAGTQLSGYSFGNGGNSVGGGGFYGGNSSGGGGSGSASGGGSGYIGNSLLYDKYMYCYNCEISDNEHTLTYTTSNVSFQPVSNYAKTGDGAAKITFLYSKKELTYGSVYGELPIPIKEDLVFSGWYTEDGVEVLESTVLENREDHTLYARWEELYDINYDVNGGMFIDNIYTSVGEHQLIIPIDAEYQLEVWGAQGGSGKTSGKRGGYGGYSTGKIFLTANEQTYINVGGQGATPTSISVATWVGGYNGGGSGSCSGSGGKYGAGGGGASHIATKSGILSEFKNYTDDLLIVAGGGGAGFNHSSSSLDAIGGDGGGYIGVGNTPGTQLSGGGTFGQGYNSTSGGSGGGGGYYGGGYGNDSMSSGGGSGYIGNSLLTDKYMYCYNCTTSNEKNILTYSTINVSDDAIFNYAKSGNGAVRIKQVVSVKQKKNGQVYGELPIPMREGYTFLGWFTEVNGGAKITSDTVFNGTSDQTLYAHWAAN